MVAIGLVDFSCKGRGWCPSCTTRRALETGAHLEAVLPRGAHRQGTLSLCGGARDHHPQPLATCHAINLTWIRGFIHLVAGTRLSTPLEETG